MNIPYVKQYNEFGICTNPIKGKYINEFPNRGERKQKDKRAFNNKKGIQLVVSNIGKGRFVKYRKRLQRVGGKTIVHYVEIKNIKK